MKSDITFTLTSPKLVIINSMKILYIEDEENIAKPVIRVLRSRNYLVDYAMDGKKGLAMILENNYDCIVLDLNLPEISGIDICKKARELGIATPILMLTARSQIYNKLEGFDVGTDDYLTKPFDLQELLARINALIKRGSPNKNTKLRVGNLVLDTGKNQLNEGEKIYNLSNKECAVLEYLILNKGRAVSTEELLEHVWDTNMDLFTDTVKTHIKTLRSKMNGNGDLIKTIKGKGYLVE